MSAFSPARARPYDLFKSIVTVILLIIIIILLLRFNAAPAAVAPAIGAVSAGLDGRVSASGRGQPGAALELWAGGARLGAVTVAADGGWSYSGQVAPGDYQLIARTVDASGKAVSESAPAAFTAPAAAAASAAAPAVAPTTAPTAAPTAVPTAAPTSAPTAAPTAVPTAAPTAVPTAAPTSAPTAAPTAVPTAAPAPAPTAVAAGAAAATAASARINAPQAGSAGKLALDGTGQPGATLELWANGTKLATVTVGSDGKWSYAGELAPGEYQVTARTVDAGGKMLNESAPQAVKVPAAAQAGATPAGEGSAYVVQPGDWLTKLAVQFYGEMDLYTRIVEATNARAAQDSSFARITDVDAIEVGQKLWIPAK